MKIKPAYFYAGLIAIVIIYLFISTRDTKTVSSSNGIQNKEMPQDETHKGMNPPGQQGPNKGNVSAGVLHQMEMLKKEMDENPGDTAKIKAYADFLVSAHQPDNAIPLYKKLLVISPKDNDAHFSLAYIYYNKRDLVNAEKEMDAILSYDRNNPQALYNKGAIIAAQGDKLQAENIWKDVVKRFPGTDAAKLAGNGLQKLKK